MPGYDVADRLPVSDIDPGTSLLVAGPPLTGKRQLALSMLEDGCEDGEGTALIGTRDSVRSIQRSAPEVWNAVAAGRGGVVDCVTRQSGETVQDEEMVKFVASPGDVTDIGIRLNGILQRLERECDRARVNVSTVSTMLMYADVRRVYRFLHVLTGHTERLDWLGLGVLDTSNREAFDTIAPLYDGMIQTRQADEGKELRVVGLGEGRTEWMTY